MTLVVRTKLTCICEFILVGDSFWVPRTEIVFFTCYRNRLQAVHFCVNMSHSPAWHHICSWTIRFANNAVEIAELDVQLATESRDLQSYSSGKVSTSTPILKLETRIWVFRDWRCLDSFDQCTPVFNISTCAWTKNVNVSKPFGLLSVLHRISGPLTTISTSLNRFYNLFLGIYSSIVQKARVIRSSKVTESKSVKWNFPSHQWPGGVMASGFP